MDSANEKSFSCKPCPKQFKTKFSISNQVRIEHEKLKPFECSICGSTFDVRRSTFGIKGRLQRHVDLVHENKKVKLKIHFFKEFLCSFFIVPSLKHKKYLNEKNGPV